jgi:transposase-like protein
MGNRKNGKSRRQYSDELKAEAVQMLLEGHSAESVASRLGLNGQRERNSSHTDGLHPSPCDGTLLRGQVQRQIVDLVAMGRSSHYRPICISDSPD